MTLQYQQSTVDDSSTDAPACVRNEERRCAIFESCMFCQKRFNSGSDLRQHIMSNHCWFCRHCFRDFSTARTYSSHVRMKHPGERPFRCQICGEERIQDEHDYDNHLFQKHNYPYFCPRCSSLHYNRTRFDSHRLKCVRKDINVDVLLGKIGQLKSLLGARRL